MIDQIAQLRVQVDALPPHAAGAGVRARLADHGMTRCSRIGLGLVLGLGRRRAPTTPVHARRRRRSRSTATTRRRAQPELGFDGGAPVGDWAFAARLGYVDQPIALRDGATVVEPVRAARDAVARRRDRARRTRSWSTRGCRWRTRSASSLTALGESGALAHFVVGDLRVGARLRVAARLLRVRAPSSRRRPATTAASPATAGCDLRVEPDRPVRARGRRGAGGDRRACGCAATR